MSLISTSVKSIIRKVNVMDSEAIYIQVKFWRTEGQSLVLQKGTNNELSHVLGSYEGPLPPNDELEKLFAKGGDIKQIIREQIPILYGEDPEMGLFPILKGSTLSFFIPEEDYEKIEECFNTLGTNALSFRLKVPQVNPILLGRSRGEDTRPIFSVRITQTLFENGVEVDKWDVNSESIPVFIPPQYENHEMIGYQKEAKEANILAAAKQPRKQPDVIRSSGLVVPTSLVEPVDPVRSALLNR